MQIVITGKLLFDILMGVFGFIIAFGGAFFMVTKFSKTYKDWKEARRKDKMEKLAKELYLYHSANCEAPKLILEFKKTVEIIQKQNEILIQMSKNNTKLTLKSLGDRIRQKCKYWSDLGYMPQEEKDEMFKEFIEYWINGGNGLTQIKVGLALNLPTENDGESVNIDLTEILKQYTRISV